MDIYKRFMAELDAGSPKNGAKLTETLSEVDVTNPEDVKALITTDGTDVLVHFGDQDFLTRYKSFEEHLPEWRQQYPKLASADMRYEDQIVLEMQKGTNVPLAGDAAPVNAAATDDSTPAAVPAPASATSRSPAGMTTRNTNAKAKTPTAKPSHAVAKPATPKPVATKTKAAASKPAAAKPSAGVYQ
jgi:cell division protein FtsQ